MSESSSRPRHPQPPSLRRLPAPSFSFLYSLLLGSPSTLTESGSCRVAPVEGPDGVGVVGRGETAGTPEGLV